MEVVRALREHTHMRISTQRLQQFLHPDKEQTKPWPFTYEIKMMLHGEFSSLFLSSTHHLLGLFVS